MSTPQTRLSAPASAAAGHIDILLADAGISGIGAGYHLKTRLPGTTLLILHARDRIGGTWDLRRYPGVRPASDLPTFACQFKPWTRDNGRFWINGQAVGLGEDGEADGWLSPYEHFALAVSDPHCRQVRRTWSPGQARPHGGQRR